MDTQETKPYFTQARAYAMAFLIAIVLWLLFGDKTEPVKNTAQPVKKAISDFTLSSTNSETCTNTAKAGNKGYLKGDGSPSKAKKFKR